MQAADFFLHANAVHAIAGWPSGQFVTVRFVAGYPDAASVPGAIKTAIRVKVEELYDGVDRTKFIDDILTQNLLLVA